MNETDLPDDFYLGPAGFLPPDAVGARVVVGPLAIRGVLIQPPTVGYSALAYSWGAGSATAVPEGMAIRLDLTPAPDGQPVRSVAPMLHAIAEADDFQRSAQPVTVERHPGGDAGYGMAEDTGWLISGTDGEFNEWADSDLPDIPADLSPDQRLRRALVLIAQALEQR